MTDFWFNAIGLGGVALILLAYFLLQKGVFHAHQARYLWMNIVGSLAIIASLFEAWNLPSFFIQCCWILISLYGLWYARRM